VLDIGLGELLLMAVLALLVFGPERLPKVAADAARTLRQVRRMATEARRDLADAAGIEGDPELSAAVRDLRDLDPRRVLEPLDDLPGPVTRGAAPTLTPGAQPDPTPAASTSPTPAAAGTAEPAPAAATPVAAPPVDPDWT
jgi:sec-independent protein translocase protein TatB